MPYIGNSQAQAPAYALERDLLLSGLSYTEVAEQTGQRVKTISERNRLIHKVDIYGSFVRRVAREGIPRRVPADALTSAWFVGLVDGEGSFVIFTREGPAGYQEFRLGLRIALRRDDAPMLEIVRDHLGVGTINYTAARGSTNETVAWRCERVTDLTEVLVPVFDAIPLRSKKAREFALWKPLVERRYLDTMGGYSNRLGAGKEYRASFQQAIDALAKIRTYTAGVA